LVPKSLRFFGKGSENRDYIRKDGKWKESEKGTTSVEGTFEEYGECPEEHQGKSREADRILELLKGGADNLEVIEAVPYTSGERGSNERNNRIFAATFLRARVSAKSPRPSAI